MQQRSLRMSSARIFRSWTSSHTTRQTLIASTRMLSSSSDPLKTTLPVETTTTPVADKIHCLEDVPVESQAAMFGSSQTLSGNDNKGRKGKFCDAVLADFKGGKGGDGSLAFEHLGFMQKRPNGGHGGNGGSVILRATRNCRSLNFYGMQRGKDGVNGGRQEKEGRHGKDLYVKVPLGTTVWRVRAHRLYTGAVEIEDREEEDYVMDMDTEGQELLVAQGGKRGRGNCTRVFMSNRHFPHLERETQSGESGEFHRLRLVLKTIADVGLVGFPNAGKSTFLRAISRAKPEVAPYPFTTLHPNVGTVEFSDFEQMTVADIPGIVDGAHEGKGLGHVFLRHIERTKLLVYMVDVLASVTEDRENVSPGADLASLISELELYMPGLSTRRCIVVANKMDKLPRSRQAAVLAELEAAMPYSSEGLFAISAQRGGGVKEVVTALRSLVDTAPAAEDDPSLPQSIVGKNGRFLAQDSDSVNLALARQAQDQAEEEFEQRNYIRNLKSKRRGKIQVPGTKEELDEIDEEFSTRDAQLVREAELARRAAARLTRGWMKHKHDK